MMDLHGLATADDWKLVSNKHTSQTKIKDGIQTQDDIWGIFNNNWKNEAMHWK